MLILTRCVNEKIRIGEDITITLFGIKDNKQIRLGIDAPRDIDVHREEIYQKIQKKMSLTQRECEEKSAEESSVIELTDQQACTAC